MQGKYGLGLNCSTYALITFVSIQNFYAVYLHLHLLYGFLLLNAVCIKCAVPLYCIGFGLHKPLDTQAVSCVPRFNNKRKDSFSSLL